MTANNGIKRTRERVNACIIGLKTEPLVKPHAIGNADEKQFAVFTLSRLFLIRQWHSFNMWCIVGGWCWILLTVHIIIFRHCELSRDTQYSYSLFGLEQCLLQGNFDLWRIWCKKHLPNIVPWLWPCRCLHSPTSSHRLPSVSSWHSSHKDTGSRNATHELDSTKQTIRPTEIGN